MSKYLELDHIGIILKGEFMEPFGLSMNALAKAINVPANRIHGIIHDILDKIIPFDINGIQIYN